MSIMRYQVIIDDISHNYIIILTFHLIVDLVPHNFAILCIGQNSSGVIMTITTFYLIIMTEYLIILTFYVIMQVILIKI